MKVKAQIAMVMNLDKCIGCHTCSIPCKNVWTNRSGAEYIWFNNVETKPGLGYPQRWENQQEWKGGWLSKKGKLALRAGGRMKKSLLIFQNPDLPHIEDYYEPWTYGYEELLASPPRKNQPIIRSKSLISGRQMDITWGPNWEDDLAGTSTRGAADPDFEGLDSEIYLQFKDVFMFWLPRICEHCLNPACVASCPSGALYKRDEDGIVLVDQEKCRGWRFCVSGCPYKKVYFNWKAGRSEKCIFCYPRIEAGLPTLCAQTCVGRIRYIGVLLYDADRIRSAAATVEDRGVYPAQAALLLDPHDPEVIAAAREEGIPSSYIEAAQISPVYKLIVDWQLALPPHPEFRTLPMVWYIPPLSPIIHSPEPESGPDRVERLRIPIRYLANLLAAGDEAPVRRALRRLLALRDYMRSLQVEKAPDPQVLAAEGMTPAMAEEMLHLLALARYRDRFVIPTAKKEQSQALQTERGRVGFPDGSLS